MSERASSPAVIAGRDFVWDYVYPPHYVPGGKAYVGKGAFSRVFHAKSRVDGIELAIKVSTVLPPGVPKPKEPPGSRTVRPTTAQQWESEVAILRTIQGHPNVIRVYDAFQLDGVGYIVMERLEEDLRTAMREARVPLNSLPHMVCQICRGLAHIHSRQLVHRDVKPENILIKHGACAGGYARVVLTDFGLASFVTPGVTMRDIAGSPHFIAPEVWDRRYSTQADVWSLGVLLYEAVFNTLPFVAARDQREISMLARAFDASERLPSGILDPAKQTVHALSDSALRFLAALLQPNPSARIGVREALCAPFLAMANDMLTPVHPWEAATAGHATHSFRINEVLSQQQPAVAGARPASSPRVRSMRAALQAATDSEMQRQSEARRVPAEVCRGALNLGFGDADSTRAPSSGLPSPFVDPVGNANSRTVRGHSAEVHMAGADDGEEYGMPAAPSEALGGSPSGRVAWDPAAMALGQGDFSSRSLTHAPVSDHNTNYGQELEWSRSPQSQGRTLGAVPDSPGTLHRVTASPTTERRSRRTSFAPGVMMHQKLEDLSEECEEFGHGDARQVLTATSVRPHPMSPSTNSLHASAANGTTTINNNRPALRLRDTPSGRELPLASARPLSLNRTPSANSNQFASLARTPGTATPTGARGDNFFGPEFHNSPTGWRAQERRDRSPSPCATSWSGSGVLSVAEAIHRSAAARSAPANTANATGQHCHAGFGSGVQNH